MESCSKPVSFIFDYGIVFTCLASVPPSAVTLTQWQWQWVTGTQVTLQYQKEERKQLHTASPHISKMMVQPNLKGHLF